MNENFTIDSESTINIQEDLELKSLTPQKTLCGGKYRLEKEVGRGGMGVVWKAWDTISERYVALKFVPPEIRHFEAAIAQVRESFRMIQDLNHQNIRPIYGLEKDEVFGYFVVMKWLEGQPLDSVRLTRSQIFQVLEKVAAALDYAHQFGVVHRDVKPSNIFLQMNGDQIREVFLVDFGISAEIQNSMSLHTGATLRTSGTRAFMPPEQWRGQTQDGRTDQYALAAVAYWLFAGRLPFHVADTQMLRDCVLLDMPDEIEGVSPEINVSIMRGLAKQRKDRFESCRKFVKAMTERRVRQSHARPVDIPVGIPVEEPVSRSVIPSESSLRPNKYPLPFIFYWKYWVILILSTILCISFQRLWFTYIIWENYYFFYESLNAWLWRPVIWLAGALCCCSGLYLSQIIWNIIKKHRFQILYGLPITIACTVFEMQFGFLASALGLNISKFTIFNCINGIFIIEDLLFLIFFSFKEEWLQPEVWNSPKSWFRLRNLFIGGILYFILIFFECIEN